MSIYATTKYNLITHTSLVNFLKNIDIKTTRKPSTFAFNDQENKHSQIHYQILISKTKTQVHITISSYHAEYVLFIPFYIRIMLPANSFSYSKIRNNQCF